MTPTWDAAIPPDLPRPTWWQLIVAFLRALVLVSMTYFGMIFVLVFNLIERWVPLGVAQTIVRIWGRLNLWLCGVTLRREGSPMQGGGALVCNHCSWIDIFTLLSADRVRFVSKAEVAKWPVVGILARQIDPVFIDRRRTEAKAHEAQLLDRLHKGQRLCFFPEGTSTDGLRVIPFKSSLFNAFMSPELKAELWVQPVTIIYHPRAGLPAEFYGWWGEMPLGSHALAVLSMSFGGEVEVVFHPPLKAAEFADRKALALASETAVRRGFEDRIRLPE